MDSESRDLNRKIQAVAGGGVFLLSLIVYLRSVAPTTSFWDCGEFIACSRILGVMHPPGAPLYLLIGRILTLLPFIKDIGLRVNLFSVFVSSATVALTFLILVQFIKRWRGDAVSWEDRVIMYASGVFGALAFAFTDSFWFNAVEAEVYAFSMFFTAIVVWLALHWGERSEKAGSLLLIFFIFYLFGLAAGVHLLNILAFPFVLLIAYFHDNQITRRLLMLVFLQAVVPVVLYVIFYQFDPMQMQLQDMLDHQDKAWKFMQWFGIFWIVATLAYFYIKDRGVFNAWWILPAVVFLGYSVYIVIFVRAGLEPPINENDPSTLQGMMDYMARKQYGEQSLMLTFLHRQADFWRYQLHLMYTRYFGWQFIGKGVGLDQLDRIIEIISFRGLYGLPFLVGLWGAVHHFFKDWKRALSILILFLLMGYAIVIYANQPDPQPRERDYSYVGSFFAFALWVGIGFTGIMEWISDALKKRKAAKKVVFGLASIALFVAVPLNLYAFNHRSHSRARNYVAWDYSYNILQSCEPDAVIFTNGDNDTFPLWYLQEVEGIRKDIRVVNLSLLNTPWYIKQLQEDDPKVPINLSNATIDNLVPIFWEEQKRYIPVPEEVVAYFEKTLENEEERASLSNQMTFTVSPTFANGQGLRVQDMMVMRIIQEARWEKPVYFAMTVSQENKVGLNEYLRMDGLAFKVMPYKVRQLDTERLHANLLDRFQYRNLDNPKVFYNTNILKLLQNYRSAFMELARDHILNDRKEEAALILDEMERRLPKEVIPYSDERHAMMINELYRWADRMAESETRTQYIIPGRQLGNQDKLWLARYYAQVFQNWDRAEALYREILETSPNEMEAYSGLFYVYRESRQYDRGITLLENWLMRNPRDESARRELEALKVLARIDTASTAPDPELEKD